MSRHIERADWLAGIRGARTDWSGLADRRRLQLAGPEMLGVLIECAEYLDRYSDYETDAHGRVEGNAAARLLHDVNQAIKRAKGEI